MTREEKAVLRLEVLKDFSQNNELKNMHEAINMAIEALERKRGEWVRHTRVEPVFSIDGVKTWGIKCQCNKCCFTTTVVEDFGYYNYCPNCGADMRGGDANV